MNGRVGRGVLWTPTGTTKRNRRTAEVVRRYTVGHESIRVISAVLGCSSGKACRLVVESGTPMQPPGGNRASWVPAAPDPAGETPSTGEQRS